MSVDTIDGGPCACGMKINQSRGIGFVKHLVSAAICPRTSVHLVCQDVEIDVVGRAIVDVGFAFRVAFGRSYRCL